jgi:hypothetical protein
MSTEIVVPGPKILLLGNPGDGKTDSLRTLVEAGLKVFVLFTEPGMEVLLSPQRGKVFQCKDGLHFRYIAAVSPSWQDMKETADLISNFSYQQITDMKTGFKKEKFRQFYDFIAAHADLKCDRCAQNFGPPDKLQPYDQWCFVQDSLSSLSLMALRLVIGSKPAAHQGEWGEAMMNLEMYVNKFVYDIPSMAVMTAHVEKEGDEVSGGLMNMAATLGRKLAPKIPRPFSDVLLAYRQGSAFWWSNVTPQYTLKSRHFAFSDKIPPNFAPAVKAWKDKIAAEAAAKGAQQEIASVTSLASAKP